MRSLFENKEERSPSHKIILNRAIAEKQVTEYRDRPYNDDKTSFYLRVYRSYARTRVN